MQTVSGHLLQTDLPNASWGNTSSVRGVNGDLANIITLVFLLFMLFVAIRVREALRRERLEEEKEAGKQTDLKTHPTSRSRKKRKPTS